MTVTATMLYIFALPASALITLAHEWVPVGFVRIRGHLYRTR